MNDKIGPPRTSAAEAIRATIPPEVEQLPNTTLLERVALSEIIRRPTVTNAALARLLVLSSRGVEAMIRRLRHGGLLKAEGKGCARRLVPLFHVEHHSRCGDDSADKCHMTAEIQEPEKAAARRDSSTSDEISFRMSAYENCMQAGIYDAARAHLQATRHILESDSNFPEVEKKRWIEGIVEAENRCVAFRVAAELAAGLPREKQKQLALAVCAAPPERLAEFRGRVESGLLTFNVATLMKISNA